MPPSDLKITSGLSLFDCQDHHAILGIPLNSDQKVIRKRYLKIARKLHPDSVGEGVDKQTASMLLSKLINPSYEFLSNPSQMEEYNILLKLVGQRYSRDINRFPVKSDEAKAVLQAQDFENAYRSSLETLSQQQFEQLNHYLDVTASISELNLVYLYRQEGSPAVARSTPASGASRPPTSAGNARATQNPRATSANISSTSTGASAPSGAAAAEPARTVNHDLVDQYYRRAEELIAKACYLEAVRELKEVVEGNNPIDPNNSKVYALLGDIYKEHMKQPVMARPFYTKALKADPNNARVKKKLSDITPSSASRNRDKSAATAATKNKKKPGFFNFLSRKK